MGMKILLSSDIPTHQNPHRIDEWRPEESS